MPDPSPHRAGPEPTVRGFYVVVEGIDGAGKSELAKSLSTSMRASGRSVAEFREPNDPFLREEAIRLSRADPVAASLCFTVDRLLQRPEVDRALAGGALVIQDRSFYSTIAYQGADLPEAARTSLERVQLALVRVPDLVLYLDVAVDLALERVGRRGPREPFEEREFLERVRARFERLFEAPRWVRLDGAEPPEPVLRQALSIVEAALRSHRSAEG